jgi:hypothetical protein
MIDGDAWPVLKMKAGLYAKRRDKLPKSAWHCGTIQDGSHRHSREITVGGKVLACSICRYLFIYTKCKVSQVEK